MAGPSAADWIEALDRNALLGVQPILSYNMERRRLQEEARLRAQQLQDEQRKRGYQLEDASRTRGERLADIAEEERFSTERDLISARRQEQRDIAEHQFRTDLETAATKRAVELRKQEWDHADRVTKENVLRELRGKADRLGIPPPPSADFETAFDYYNREVNKAESTALVDLVKQGVALQREFSGLTNSTEQERAQLQMSILLGGNYADATKVLTPQERLALARDPAAIVGIQDRLAKDKSKKGKLAFEAFDQALNDSDTAATSIYAKRSTQNKERLEAIKGLMSEHRAMVSSRFKDAVLGPDTVTGMFSGILDEMKRKNQQAQPAAPTLPPLPPPPQSAAPSGQPQASSQFPGLIPLAGRAANAVASEAGQIMEPVARSAGMAAGDVASALFGGNFRNPLSAFKPQVPADTPFTALLRSPAMIPGAIPPGMADFLEKQSRVAPTAFPLLRVPGLGGASVVPLTEP